MSQESTNRSFDDLARAMAEGSLSRRRALKLIAGTAIAALIPSRALADDDCVRICHVPFDRETEECDFANARTRCVSRRERRRHLENHPCDCRGRCANCLTVCLPNGEPCTEQTAQQCCSKNCSGGKCAAACTSNGSLISCLDKTATPSTVTVGQPITFTITERCPGAPGCVESFPLVDQVPSGLTVISVDPAGCITIGNTVTCGSRSFGPAAPFTLTIVATPTQCGTFTNTVSNGRDTAEASFTVLC